MTRLSVDAKRALIVCTMVQAQVASKTLNARNKEAEIDWFCKQNDATLRHALGICLREQCEAEVAT